MNLIEPLPSLSSLNVEMHSGATEALYVAPSCQLPGDFDPFDTSARRVLGYSRVSRGYGRLHRRTLTWRTLLRVSDELVIFSIQARDSYHDGGALTECLS